MMDRTIVMIHGMFGGSWCWDNYRRFFTDRGCRCLAPALRHHEADPRDEPHPDLGTTSLLDYADDLEKVIRGLDEKPVVMGHSMGGLIAQILGSRGLARLLVLLTPATPAGILAIDPSVIKSAAVNVCEWGFWKKPIRSTYEATCYSAMHLLPEPERREAFSRFGYESGRALFEMGFWFLDGRQATRIDAAAIAVPVLIVSGAEDRITPSSGHRKLARKYLKMASFMEFPNHAHWIFGEPGWETIASHIHLWLSHNSGG